MQVQPSVSSPERLYYSSISSPYTQRLYRTYLQKYLAFYGMKNVSELLAKDHKEVESQIIEFIITLKEKGMKRSAIANYTSPILGFCKIMDIMVNTTKINKFMPPQIKSKKTFAYTHEQIQKLLDIADERMRLVVLLACLTRETQKTERKYACDDVILNKKFIQDLRLVYPLRNCTWRSCSETF